MDAPYGLGEALFWLGYATDATGDAAAAAAHYTSALQRLGEEGDAYLAGFVHSSFGATEGRHGELPCAVEHVQAAVRISATMRDRWLLSYAAQTAVALVAAHPQQTERARLLGAAEALAQATGATYGWEHLPGAENVMGLREQLAREEGEGELGAAYRAGRALPFGEVAALALTLLQGVAQALPLPGAAPGGSQTTERLQATNPLTAREQEVLRLVAQGLTSKAIGQQLFLAPSTVNHHLTTIFNKLGVDTRAQAVAVAVQNGLV